MKTMQNKISSKKKVWIAPKMEKMEIQSDWKNLLAPDGLNS
jgi:hypothetical protein